MPYAVAAAAVAAGGSIYASQTGANAAKSAANTQAGAANNASATELGMYNQTVGREAPYVNAGNNALGQMQSLIGTLGGPGGPTNPILAMLGIGPGGASGGGINPSTFQGSPGYQYELQQGQNAVTNSNAHAGLGGNALRELQQNGQQLANQNWNQYLGNASGAYQNALQNYLGPLSGLVTGGQNAAGNLGTIGTGVGNQVGGNQLGAGNALAGAQIGAANAQVGGINKSLEALMTQLSNGGNQTKMNNAFASLFGGSPSYSSVDPNGQSVALNTWSSQPDSYYLPGGGGYGG